MESKVEIINVEINKELANPEVSAALLATTFKGLNALSMKKAIMEGMIRGFEFKDFLEKNVYAIPFKDSYSLVTSIDYARKRGMKGQVVGKSAPSYEEKDGKIVSCTVTIKRLVAGQIGDFTATVYFDEYYKSNQYKSSLWDTKPRTMIAKVAEMHALRMACPEELSQSYIEEEFETEKVIAKVADGPATEKVSHLPPTHTVSKPNEKDTAGPAYPVGTVNPKDMPPIDETTTVVYEEEELPNPFKKN